VTTLADPLAPQLVTTPEGLVLRFTTATASERIAAFALDALLLTLLLAAGAILMACLAPALQGAVRPFFALWFFLLRFCWFAWAEIRGGGRTPGKRRFHLRVIRSDGGPLTAEVLIARNLTREIETFLPVLLVISPDLLFAGHDGIVRIVAVVWVLVLLFFPLTNAQRLRIGDLLAGTRVVVSPPAALARDLAATGKQSGAAKDEPAAAPEFSFPPEQLRIYGEHELSVLEDVLRKAPADGKDPTLAAVAKSICRRIGIADPTAALAKPLPFLRAFYAAQRGHLEQGLLLGKRRRDKHAR